MATDFYGRVMDFNPRTHVGCDQMAKFLLPLQILFQSTHPRGVRHKTISGKIITLQISIHAPTWGATVKPSNDWLLGHKDNEFANENIIIINSVNIT